MSVIRLYLEMDICPSLFRDEHLSVSNYGFSYSVKFYCLCGTSQLE